MSTEITRRDGQWKVIVNGTDLTRELIGFTVESDPESPDGPPKVTLRMKPSAAMVDVDEAEIITVPHEEAADV